MTRRRAVVATLGLLTWVVVYALATSLLPPDSIALPFVADLGIVTLEAALLVLSWMAFKSRRHDPFRWIWLLLTVWSLGNLVGDGTWAYQELVQRVQPTSPGPADAGYLFSYFSSMIVLVAANWKSLRRLRALESILDAGLLVVGITCLVWPLVLAPIFDSYHSGPSFWMQVIYMILDLLAVFAFVSLIFGYTDSRRARPPSYFTLFCAVFVLHCASDAGYFLAQDTAGGIAPGGWPDITWTLGFALGGVAAVLALSWPQSSTTHRRRPYVTADAALKEYVPPAWRAALPYAALPVLAALFAVRATTQGWRWDTGSRVFAYLGILIVLLLVSRQYVSIIRNRRLYADLTKISRELESRVADLADVNQRLEDLSDSSSHLTRLRQPHAVARAGLEIACSFTGSPGGWITMGSGADSLIVTLGPVDAYLSAGPQACEPAAEQALVRAFPLRIRDEEFGTMCLLEPSGGGPASDLLHLVAAQLASALENAKHYDEALQLAERDPLTGLYNHRGIHKRLAGEFLRAQQSEAELSLVMIDLDDFKVLNDTYGHAAGDSVLRQVGDAIRSVLRHADLAGRVGGDELLLVLPNTGAEGASQLGDRLQTCLAAHPYVSSGGEPITVGLSLGVATMPSDAQSVGRLIEIADSNLYASKQRGGNTTTSSNTPHEDSSEAQGVLGIAGRLLDAVGARDHYTRRHSERVVKYSLALGESLALPADSLRTLHVAAMLHDVGKLGISPQILRRPTPLDPTEETQVRGHVLLSSEIVMDIPRLAEVADAVAAHHERYDGGGYPADSSGGEIPLLGRILAVADAYSAMTVDRPYQKGMTPAQAREELLRAAGTQLDPELVQAFLEVLDTERGDLPQEQAAAG